MDLKVPNGGIIQIHLALRKKVDQMMVNGKR